MWTNDEVMNFLQIMLSSRSSHACLYFSLHFSMLSISDSFMNTMGLCWNRPVNGTGHWGESLTYNET